MSENQKELALLQSSIQAYYQALEALRKEQPPEDKAVSQSTELDVYAAAQQLASKLGFSGEPEKLSAPPVSPVQKGSLQVRLEITIGA